MVGCRVMKVTRFSLRSVAVAWILTFRPIALFLSAGCLSISDVIAQKNNEISIEIVAPRDAAGKTYVPHGEPFEVKLFNLSDHRVIIWQDSCEEGHEALSFRTKDQSGRNNVAKQRAVP